MKISIYIKTTSVTISITLCQAVEALAIDKAGPRPYHFCSGPTSGPTTRPGSQKSKISVVHNLAVLKGHPRCLKRGKTLWRPAEAYSALPDPLAGGEEAG